MKDQRLFRCKIFVSIISSLLITNCASRIQKADIPSTANPTNEIVSLDQDINAGFRDHYNILANDDFRKSYTYLKDAKKDLDRGEKSEVVLDDVRYGRAYLNRAKETTEARAGKIENILEARTDAIAAGAQSYSDSSEMLRIADDHVRRVATGLDKLSPKEFSDLQAQYLDIELLAIKNDNLGKAKSMVDQARSDGALKRAPKTLNQTEIEIRSAENQIEANRNIPTLYQPSVDKANAQAQLLTDVMNVSNQADHSISEKTALQIVMQNRQIASLNSALSESSRRTRILGRTVNTQSRELEAATSTLVLQRALDSARDKFTAREADVYQQNEKLLLRLKSISFASGSAILPKKSFPTLNKVVTVAKDLGPSEVLIEGHTDATGSTKANTILSQKRAEAVANYLEKKGIGPEVVRATGFGSDRPIASNKTAAGRSQNRRVDIVITPIGANTIEQQTRK